MWGGFSPEHRGGLNRQRLGPGHRQGRSCALSGRPRIIGHKNSHAFYESSSSDRSPAFAAVVDCKMCGMKYL